MKANAVAKRPKPPLSKRLKRDWHKNKWKYIMLLPVLIYLLLFCYKPMYGLVTVSYTHLTLPTKRIV